MLADGGKSCGSGISDQAITHELRGERQNMPRASELRREDKPGGIITPRSPC